MGCTIRIRPALLLAILCCLGINASADETTDAPSPETTRLFASSIPVSWVCERTASTLIIHPREAPVFVNLVGTAGRQPNQTEEEFYRSQTVKIDYQIILRFQPLLSPDQVRQMVKENQAISERLRMIERSPLVEMGKGFYTFRKTPDGQRLGQEYFGLKQSIRPIPNGYVDNHSVFIEPTSLSFATFLNPQTQSACEDVQRRLTGRLTSY